MSSPFLFIKYWVNILQKSKKWYIIMHQEKAFLEGYMKGKKDVGK